MAPGGDGSLYVSISVRKGPAVLLLLDGAGQPRAGWPVAIKGSTRCGLPMPSNDGSVRVVCDARDLPESNSDDELVEAYSFDADGRLIAGWPAELSRPTAYALDPVRGDLTLVREQSTDDPASGETLTHDVTVTAIDAGGTVHEGSRSALDLHRFGDRWTVRPDGVAYGVGETDELGMITALDRSGARDGWPVTIKGFGSVPGFEPDGAIAVTLGSTKPRASHLALLDPSGKVVTSGALPITTAERTGDVGGCTVAYPNAPVVARNGDIFVISELETPIYGLDGSLAIMDGWPFDPSASLAVARPGLESEHEAGYCPTSVIPGVGPDGTLVLALEAQTSKVGGSLVAVGSDASVRAGWPVVLKRPGAEFWGVVVGTDATTYALALEPESGGKSSASILAIAPDSTIRWTTTIIDP